jgi:phosphoglycolate phosphatase
MDLASIIFDLDGTLVDSLEGIEYSVDRALEAKGYPARTGGLRPLIGPPIRHILSEISNEKGAQALDKLEAAFRGSYDTEGWKKTVLMNGAGKALNETASARLRMFLVTNKPYSATTRIVDFLGIANFFERIVCRDSATPHYSSKAEMLRSLITQDGVLPENSIVVGDTREDFESAAKVGMAAAILASDYAVWTQAPPHRPPHLLRTLDELASVFARLGGME